MIWSSQKKTVILEEWFFFFFAVFSCRRKITRFERLCWCADVTDQWVVYVVVSKSLHLFTIASPCSSVAEHWSCKPGVESSILSGGIFFFFFFLWNILKFIDAYSVSQKSRVFFKSLFCKSTYYLSLIHIWRCRRIERCRSRWSPYH